MKKVYQTVTKRGHGNCLAACVASILELPLTVVPNFITYSNAMWMREFMQFLRGWDCEFVGCKYGTDVLTYTKGVDGYYIVNGRSTFHRENPPVYHSVVFKDGGLVHDPNKKSTGLHTIQSCYMVERKL